MLVPVGSGLLFGAFGLLDNGVAAPVGDAPVVGVGAVVGLVIVLLTF